MKKILCLVLCAMLLILPLSACGDDNPASVSDSDAAGEMKWIDRQFAEAEELYAWFVGCARPACNTADTVEVDGTVYERVTEPFLTDSAALRARLDTLFVPAIAEELMAAEVYSGAPVFRDIDGKLYCCREAFGQVPHDIGERIGTIDSQMGTEMVYRVDITYDYYASSFAASCDYTLLLGEDGKWRFETFRLPALLIAEQMFQSDDGTEE